MFFRRYGSPIRLFFPVEQSFFTTIRLEWFVNFVMGGESMYPHFSAKEKV